MELTNSEAVELEYARRLVEFTAKARVVVPPRAGTESKAGWSEDRVETLKRLWTEGQSASQIAAELGGVSRNAVVGKVHRLGLPVRAKDRLHRLRSRKRKTKLQPPSASRPRFVERKPSPAAALFSAQSEPLPPPAETDIARVQLMDLEPHHCRWPAADSPGFCGCQKVAGLPYCEPHARRAFRAPEPKRGIGDISKGRDHSKPNIRVLEDA